MRPSEICTYKKPDNVRFSNRSVGVKRFQTIHLCSVDVAHGLALLFGIGIKALPSWDSKTRRNNLLDGLAVRRMAGPSDQTNSPHPSSREGHHSPARWSSSILLSHVILNRSHAAAASSRVQRNSVPSSAGPGKKQPQHESGSGSHEIGEYSSSTERWNDVPRGTMDEVSSFGRLDLPFV